MLGVVYLATSISYEKAKLKRPIKMYFKMYPNQNAPLLLNKAQKLFLDTQKQATSINRNPL